MKFGEFETASWATVMRFFVPIERPNPDYSLLPNKSSLRGVLSV